MTERADQMKVSLLEMADERGEIACTSNTHDLLCAAVDAGLAKCVSGKFKCVEPGKLNSIYRLTEECRS